MKKYLLSILLSLLATNGFGQRYLRIYDKAEKRIATGLFIATTDSSIVVKQDRVTYEISYRDIRTIRAYRTIFHDILLSSLITIPTAFAIGRAQDAAMQQTNSRTDYYGFNFHLNLPSNTEFNTSLGIFAGQLIGSSIYLAKKKRKYRLDGSHTAWLAIRAVLEKELKK